MSLIVLPAINSGTSKARIGYDNILERATTISPSSEDTANPFANCFDWNTYDYFKPAAGGGVTIDVECDEDQTADYLAFYNQDLFSLGGTIKLQYFDGAGYVDASEVVVPTDNTPRMIFFDAKTSSQWRIIITCPDVFSLGVLSFGQYLGLPRPMYMGWTAPKLARSTRILSSESEGGSLLGRSKISEGVKTALVVNNAPDDWVDAYWPAFVEHAEGKGFFFAPNVSSRPLDAVYCWTDGEIPPLAHIHYGYMGGSIPIKGVVE